MDKQEEKNILSRTLGEILLQKKYTIATMESCTAGLVGSYITDISGSSGYMRGGIISYATDIKVLYGVDQVTIDAHGVISDETALAMAVAICGSIQTDVGIGITGVAGPRMQEDKEPGEVHIAVVTPLIQRVQVFHFLGERIAIKEQAAIAAIQLCINVLRI